MDKSLFLIERDRQWKLTNPFTSGKERMESKDNTQKDREKEKYKI